MVAVCCSVQSILQKKYGARVEKKGTHERIKQTELKHEQKHHLELWQSDFIGNKIITCWRESSIDWQTMKDVKGLYISRQVSFDMETCKTSGQNRQDAFKSITSTQIADQIDLNVY